VRDVYRGGPAAEAGVRSGDVILTVGGVEVSDPTSLNYRIGIARPGDRVPVTLVRDGREVAVTVRAEAPPGDASPQTYAIQGRNPLSGATVADLTPALADQLGADPVSGGVILAGVSGRSYAAAAGFQRGDIVRAVNGSRIGSVRELEEVLARNHRGWEVTIVRNGREVTGRF